MINSWAAVVETLHILVVGKVNVIEIHRYLMSVEAWPVGGW
jgi:hypothetical protein